MPKRLFVHQKGVLCRAPLENSPPSCQPLHVCPCPTPQCTIEDRSRLRSLDGSHCCRVTVRPFGKVLVWAVEGGTEREDRAREGGQLS